jgi:glutathione synthase/RimK-type ligase-like ATP-grasp enzyme
MQIKKKELLVLPPVENIDEIIKNMAVKVTKAYYSALEFCFVKNKVSVLHEGRDIKTFSFVWLSSSWNTRDLATAVKIYLERNNVPHSFVEQSTSKITDSMHFVLNNILYPCTYYVETFQTEKFFHQVEKTCGFPLIMKDSKGFGGNGLKHIKSMEELVSIVSNRSEKKRYIFQKYIENDYDWGVLVANNKVISAEKSYPKKGEFRNNACAGAKEVFVKVKDIPENVKEMALKAAKILDLRWSRSDIIVDKVSGVPYLLEVNRFPGITSGSSEVTGATNFVKSFF